MRSLALFLIGESIHHRTPRAFTVLSDEGQFSQQAPLRQTLRASKYNLHSTTTKARWHICRTFSIDRKYFIEINISTSMLICRSALLYVTVGRMKGRCGKGSQFIFHESANPGISPPKLFISEKSLLELSEIILTNIVSCSI